MLLEREKIAVHGIVQGVGFRPFIHKLVQEYGLRGFIKNTSSGVELELEGERETLERFTEALPLRAPKLAVIESVEAEFTAELKNYPDFRILKSTRPATLQARSCRRRWGRGTGTSRWGGSGRRYLRGSGGWPP